MDHAMQLEFTLILIVLISVAMGSFLNVIIHRLPIMLDQRWQRDPNSSQPLKDPSTFNLMSPASHCPQCYTPLKWWHNLPLISYLFLRGRCAFCAKRITFRYFIVEALTLLLSLSLIIKFGLCWQLLRLLILTWLMIAISFIDYYHLFIPDSLNYGLLWTGLLFSTTPLWPYSSPTSAIIGASMAYLLFSVTAYLFKLISKKSGIGQGDFKLIAALAAWSGWQLLPIILLISGVLALIYGIVLIAITKQNRAIPFAPFLCLGSWLALLYQPVLLTFYFH